MFSNDSNTIKHPETGELYCSIGHYGPNQVKVYLPCGNGQGVGLSNSSVQTNTYKSVSTGEQKPGNGGGGSQYGGAPSYYASDLPRIKYTSSVQTTPSTSAYKPSFTSFSNPITYSNDWSPTPTMPIRKGPNAIDVVRRKEAMEREQRKIAEAREKQRRLEEERTRKLTPQEIKEVTNLIRESETKVFGKPLLKDYENIDKTWWSNRNNVNKYIAELNYEIFVKKRVDEARDLQRELYGEYETPSYDQITSNSNSKEYWGSVKQSDSYLENLRYQRFVKGRIDEARNLETELYGKVSVPTFKEVREQQNLEYWGSVKQSDSYLNQLRSDSFVKRRVDEARKLEQELYGSTTTPMWDKVTKNYWTQREQSDEYLGQLRFDKFVKERVDEARGLEQELYGNTTTPTWNKVTKSYWAHREQSDEYLGQLRFDSFIKQQVDKARELETKLYGKSLTDTWDNVNKEWWNNQSNSANYLEGLQEKASLKKRVDFVRKLEGEIYEIAKTPTWDNVNKEWWNNKTNIATYLNELNEKRNPTQKQKMEDIQAFFGVKPKAKGMVDDIFNGKYQVLNTEINLEVDDSNFVGEIGKNIIKALGAVGRQVKKLVHEYPEMIETADKLLEASTVAENYAVTKAGNLIGKEQELITNRNNLSEAFKNVQKELVGFYNKKCSELGLNKDDQAGVATLGFLMLATTKGGVKWTTKRRIKDAQLPNEGRVRFVPREDYHPSMPLFKGQNNGYIDKFGNQWTKGPSRTLGEAFEWDVQLSEIGKKQLGWAARDGNHINVSLKGHITHK